MQSTQSKLMIQLQKQQSRVNKIVVNQNTIQSIFLMLTKAQSKNLMLVQLLIFLIEKGFVKNKYKLFYFMDLYNCAKNNSENIVLGVSEDEKFTQQKFLKVLKEMAQQFYPCEEFGLEIIYNILDSNSHHEDVRIKIDDNLKKLMTKQIITQLKSYDRELQIIFQIYFPENFNNKLNFTWQQIKFLQMKLPIISILRFLWDSEICPLYLTPTHFLQITSKLIPPHSLLTKLGEKQGLFYSPETIVNYTKDNVNQKKIKLLEGDIGVSFFQFQMLLVRLSVDITKEKNDFSKAFENLLELLRLKQTIANKGQTKNKPTKFQQNVKNYFLENKKGNKNSFQVQKRQTKKKIQQILEVDQKIHEDSRNQFKDSNITLNELLTIKKNLDDDHLPQIPEIPIIEKQNNRNYKIQQKNIVIGEQLPKLPQKNTSVAAPKKNDKKDDLTNKFKYEQTTQVKLSTDYVNQLIKAPKKPRINTEVPIILMDIVYPNDIPNIYLNPKAQIYLQTTFIHLSQRSYQKAFINYIKARTLCQNVKNQTTQFFFLILQAQIYEAAARDGMALLNYHKAKELALNMVNKDIMLKYIAYKGLGCCLYHVQQYQYALRCFMKARQLRIGQIQLQSIQNGVLENNIGCIYMILNRNNQAMKHLALSQKIMDLKLGKFNERSIIVQQNERKNKKAYIQMVPTYKTMWKTYVQKPNLKPVKAPKKK